MSVSLARAERTRIMFRTVCVAVGLLALLIAARPSQAADLSPGTKASSNKAARDEAVRSLPIDQLAERSRGKLDRILQHTTLYRHIAADAVDVDPQLHGFLIRHPDVLANIWEVLEISKVQMQQTGPTTYRAQDGSGTVGNIEYLYSDKDTQVIFAEGTYEGPLFTRKVRGECILLVRTNYVRQNNGRPAAVNQLDMFVRLDNIGVEFIAKTFQPLINKCADANFADTTGFIGTLSKTAERNPDGVDRLSNKLKRLEPQVREEFSQIALTIPDRAEAAAIAARNAAPRQMAMPAAAVGPRSR